MKVWAVKVLETLNTLIHMLIFGRVQKIKHVLHYFLPKSVMMMIVNIIGRFASLYQIFQQMVSYLYTGYILIFVPFLKDNHKFSYLCFYVDESDFFPLCFFPSKKSVAVTASLKVLELCIQFRVTLEVSWILRRWLQEDILSPTRELSVMGTWGANSLPSGHICRGLHLF